MSRFFMLWGGESIAMSVNVKKRPRRLRIPLARLRERARGTGHGVTALFMFQSGELAMTR